MSSSHEVPKPLEAEQDIRRWITLYQQITLGDDSWAYRSFAELVAKYGTFQQPAPWRYEGKQQPGRCFKAASEWAENTGWTYVEGYALAPSVTFFSCFEHAWCLTDGGVVADPALPDGLVTGYFGIPLSHEFRRAQQSIRGTDAVFVSDPKNPLAGINCELLISGLPSLAVTRNNADLHT